MVNFAIVIAMPPGRGDNTHTVTGDVAMAASKKAHTGDSAELDPTILLFQNGANVEAAAKASEAMWNGMVEVGQELTTFANKRLKENMEATGRLMECKQPEEAFRLQCSQAEIAAAHYLEETRRLLDIAARISHASWAPLRERTEESFKDLKALKRDR